MLALGFSASVVAAGGAQSTRMPPPIRPDVRSDIEGVWDFSSRTPLQRPSQFAGKAFLTREEAATFERELRASQDVDRRGETAEADLNGPGTNEFWLERGSLAEVDGRIPTSLIVAPADGLLPAPTAESQRRIAERQFVNGRADAADDRALNERCLRAISGPPYLPSPDANTLRIVVSPGHVALTVEKFHETRIVTLGGRHPSSAVRSWTGDARGRWDGDTAVVPMRRFSYPLYEFACHEGNYSLPNILRGARVGEQSGR